MKPNTIATYEMGRAVPSDPAINNICKEFHVNEDWLRTGKGEMFLPPPRDIIDEMIEQYGLPREFRSLTEKYLELKPEQQEAVVEYMRMVAADLMANEPSPPQITAVRPEADEPPPWEERPRWTAEEHARWEAEAREEAEEIYQQILAEKRAEAGYSASPDTGKLA